MVEINPETQKTRKERLTTVIALFAAIFTHIFIFVGGVQLYKWEEEQEKKDRLMVIQRINETRTEPLQSSRTSPGRPQAPKADVLEKGEEPPPEGGEVSEGLEEKEYGGEESEDPFPLEEDESTETAVSVVTDLAAASFTVTGPVEFHGAGTFWIRKGLPTGEYTGTFHPVTGYKTPPIQTKTLQETSKITFVGKYKRSIEVKVNINAGGATFEIRQPDGTNLQMFRPGRAFFENLPEGPYTIIYHDIPGHLTPAPQTMSLSKSGGLGFNGNYIPILDKKRAEERPVVKAAGILDRRVQMNVTSYPSTSIEENYETIRYPEIILRKSNFQQGWCRVYLVLSTDKRGKISTISIERPQPEERQQFSALIKAVDSAVRRWNYETRSAEVHVDVRFYVE